MLEETVAERDVTPPLLSLPETVPVVASLLAGVSGAVLDAGCGPNPQLSIALGRSGASPVVSVDIAVGTVRLAREMAASEGVRLLPVVADLEALPFRAGVFAGGVCDDTIEHVPDDARAVAEIARVLDDDARFVIATPNRVRLDVLVRRVRDRARGRRRPAAEYFAATSHLREYTWRDLEGLVRPVLRVRRRAQVGWGTRRRRHRLATVLVSRSLFRRVSRMVVVEVSPR